MPMEFIHMTATYSNAMLVAILPHVSDFAKKLDLPIQQPITPAQVREFKPSPIKDFVGGGLFFTNGDWFLFNRGAVTGFRSPDNVFVNESEGWPSFAFGKDNMTTNEAITFARQTLTKLGYPPELLGCDVPPKWFTGPYDTKDGKHVPHCQMRWERYPEAKTEDEHRNNDYVSFEINMEKKTVTGISISSSKIVQPSPRVDVVPELESEFRKKNSAKIFVRSNAPPSISQ
jgi:hypothetical protein